MTPHRTIYACILLIGVTLAGSAHAAKLFLVAKLVGEVSTRSDSGEEAAFGKARWLPKDMRVFTRDRSGVEALTPGYSLRFGENTVFAAGSENIQMHKGALLVRILGSKQEGLLVEGPEAALNIRSKGTLLMEVATNGGFKVIGLTGQPILSISSDDPGRPLHPGELLFLKPLDGGWSDPVYVNLTKLVTSSFLLRGFSNPATFQDEIVQVVRSQTELITKTFRAEVGDARGADNFEIKVAPASEQPETPEASDAPQPETESTEEPEPPVAISQPEEPEPATPIPPTPDPAVEPPVAPEPVVEPPVAPDSAVDAVVAPPDPSALPAVPGPPLQFHTREKPPPTMKEVFDKEAPPKFPGKVLNL